MDKKIVPQAERRKRHARCPVAAERARIHNMPAVRLLVGRFALPAATAVLTAEAFGLIGGDR